MEKSVSAKMKKNDLNVGKSFLHDYFIHIEPLYFRI